MRKVLSLEKLASRTDEFKRAGGTVVHCHGVFDLLHIGHIRYFERARELGDVLIVTVTEDRFVNKGPGRPAFSQDLRAEAIASLDCVDHVAVNRWPTAVETIRLVRPDVYAKGSDYEDESQDVTGGIAREREAIESVGGRIAFTHDISFSSSSLINRYASALAEPAQRFLERFRERYAYEAIVGVLDRVRPLRTLVIGEAILDEYQYCEAIGKSSKEPTLVVRATESELFAGGILAVANHVAAFCDSTNLVTQIGSVHSREEFIREHLSSNVDPVILRRSGAPTIVKRRFIDTYFSTKLLEVYEIEVGEVSAEDNRALCEALRGRVREFDVVIVADFGHGMLTDEAVQILCAEAKYLVVNTQANAGNLGYHTLSRYPRADLVSVAENEIRLEARDRQGDLRAMTAEISRKLGDPRVVVTRGRHGSLGYDPAEGFVEVPALATEVVDRVGAGDAALSLVGPCASLNPPMELLGFLGNLAGAKAVSIVAHRSYLERAALLKHARALLA